MFRDPKQFLLLHVEKVVLVVMVILLVLVVYAYQPWGIEVKEKATIVDNLREGERLMEGKKGGDLPVVPDYVQRVNGIIEVPWPEGEGPRLLPQNEVIFFNLKKGVWIARAPEAPPVVRAGAVFAKADRGQAVVVFQLDEQGQRRALETTAIQEYQQGLEFLRIEIYRVDKTTGEKMKITPADWLPEGLPKRYGAPPGWIDESGGTVPRVMFDEPVYIFAQAQDPEGRAREEQEWRRRMEQEMRQRMEEEMRREQDLRKRLEEERERRRTEGEPVRVPRTPPRVRTPSPRTTPRTPRTTPGVTAPSGWYYFIDRKVDPDARYEYSVVVYCKNPLFGSEPYKGEPIPQVVQSKPMSTPAGTEPKIASFKKWYFQGGTAAAELGTFKVRCFVGGRREVTMTEITDIVRELTGADAATKDPKKPTGEPQPEGVWVEANFTVRPGEEIGGKGTVTVDGERREIDFGTGCCLVSIWNDVQVVESKRSVIVPGTDGQMKTMDVLRRDVYPQKLRIAYVSRKGNLETRWQEVAPSLAGAAIPD